MFQNTARRNISEHGTSKQHCVKIKLCHSPKRDVGGAVPYILVLWFAMPQNRCALCGGFFICLAMSFLIPHSSLLIPHLNAAFHCILYLMARCRLFCHFILRFCAILLLFLAVLTLKTISLAPFLFKLYFLYLSNENLQNRKV